MPNLRITDCPIGPIRHRPATPLLPAAPCRHGHNAPRYTVAGNCVVCAKIWMTDPAGRPASDRMRRFTDYRAALEAHMDRGGWLLQLAPGLYGITDNPSTVRRHRSASWLRRCDEVQCWDEVELLAQTGPGSDRNAIGV